MMIEPGGGSSSVFSKRVLRFPSHRLRIVHDHDPAAGLERPEADLAEHLANLVDPDRAAVARSDRLHIGMHATRDSTAGWRR